MQLHPETFSERDWHAIVDRFDDLGLIQHYAYAEAKARTSSWEVERVVFEEDGVVVGAAQAVVRRLPLAAGGLVWVNRAPLHRSPDTPPGALPRMLDAMRAHWVDDGRMYLRLALPLALDVDVEDESAATPHVIRGATGGRGFRPTAAKGWASGIVDLTPPTDELVMRLRQKWRNCLYKAQRLGTEVVEATEGPVFERFLEAYRETLANADYSKSTSPEMLAELQRMVPVERRLQVFEARTEEGPVAWVVVHRSGRRAEYVAAVTRSAGRAVNAGQLLLWTALCSLKSAGAETFDLGGYDPSDRDRSGPGRFKHGLNAVPYRLVGELEACRRTPVTAFIRRRIDAERGISHTQQPAVPALAANLASASVNAAGVVAVAATPLV